MPHEKHNLREIERLNQRGGRSLSIVDLMEAGTITAEMAALCWTAVDAGSSFMTGAVPGGAGKTTLMAALLAFLPPSEQVFTTAGREVINNALAGDLPAQSTLLAHEIGSGYWYGYIWGSDAADFFRAGARGYRCVTCLHADNPRQAWEILEPLGTRRDDFGNTCLQAYMRMATAGSRRLHRVSGLYLVPDGEPRQVYAWDEGADEFRLLPDRDEAAGLLARVCAIDPGAAQSLWDERARRLGELCERGINRYRQVRRAVLESYGAAQ